MSDSLYLSLWYPNLRIAALPDKLAAVLGSFAAHGGEARVYAVTVWPVNWSEAPVFQRVYGHGERGAEPQFAIEEALELLHEDYAYEFQIAWTLWELDTPEHLDPRWVREARLVRVTAFGPLFDDRIRKIGKVCAVLASFARSPGQAHGELGSFCALHVINPPHEWSAGFVRRVFRSEERRVGKECW